MRQQPKILEYDTNLAAQPGPLGAACVLHLPPKHAQPPCGVAHAEVQQAQQASFACSGRP